MARVHSCVSRRGRPSAEEYIGGARVIQNVVICASFSPLCFGVPIADVANGGCSPEQPARYSIVHSFAWWPTLSVVVLASVTDIRSRRIPNWLVFPALIAGIVASGWLHGRDGIGRSLAGSGLAVLFCGLFYWLGGLGAGDLKLCAAVGAWIGPHQLFVAQVATGIVGGIWVLIWALYDGFLADLLRSTGGLVYGWITGKSLRNPEMTIENPLRRKMPYAPAIAIGTLFSFFLVK